MIHGDFECVALSDLVLDLSIGILEWEKAPGFTQKVKVDVACYRVLNAPPTDISECLDYSKIYDYLTIDIPNLGHIDLIETLAHDILSFLFQDQRIAAAEVTLAKLDVFNGRAVPSVTLRQSRP